MRKGKQHQYKTGGGNKERKGDQKPMVTYILGGEKTSGRIQIVGHNHLTGANWPPGESPMGTEPKEEKSYRREDDLGPPR